MCCYNKRILSGERQNTRKGDRAPMSLKLDAPQLYIYIYGKLKLHSLLFLVFHLNIELANYSTKHLTLGPTSIQI